jgi:hypothetical protein
MIAAVFGIAAYPKRLHAQFYRYVPEHRRPLDATLYHLERIAERNTYSGKERERYDNALRHLSQFTARIQQGRFDKDKLDEAIDDVQNVIDNNRMGERARRVLLRDVAELRRLRENYDRGYRYPY